jgi:polyisoprenoid-binding protein YceI
MMMMRTLTLTGMACATWLAAATPILTPRLEAQAAIAAADTGQALRLTVAPEGNEARYVVREQLVSLDLPNDAIGRTNAVTGQLVFDGSGTVVPAESKFVIDVTTLKSDKERRDGYLQRRTLETAQFPTVTLAPTAVRGMPWPLPASGTFEFALDGDVTIRDVTRSVRWQVSATAEGGAFTGTAVTSFPFEAFDLTQPKVSVVLSVENQIRLEYEFHLVPGPASGS